MYLVSSAIFCIIFGMTRALETERQALWVYASSALIGFAVCAALVLGSFAAIRAQPRLGLLDVRLRVPVRVLGLAIWAFLTVNAAAEAFDGRYSLLEAVLLLVTVAMAVMLKQQRDGRA